MDAGVKPGLGLGVVVAHGGGAAGSGDRRVGNDDCHSEMRGSGPLQHRSLFAYLTDVSTASIRGDPIPALT